MNIVDIDNSSVFTQKLFFKQGDDLRTDQLILNLFTLMDSLLKKVNLDLKMRMYGVLATRAKVGIMEFVDHSMPVQAILDKYGSIRNYFAVKNPWDGTLTAPAPAPAPAANSVSPSSPEKAAGKTQSNMFSMINAKQHTQHTLTHTASGSNSSLGIGVGHAPAVPVSAKLAPALAAKETGPRVHPQVGGMCCVCDVCVLYMLCSAC